MGDVCACTKNVVINAVGLAPALVGVLAPDLVHDLTGQEVVQDPGATIQDLEAVQDPSPVIERGLDLIPETDLVLIPGIESLDQETLVIILNRDQDHQMTRNRLQEMMIRGPDPIPRRI